MTQTDKKILYIFGTGGHARVILSEILILDTYDEIIFVSPNNNNEDMIRRIH